MRYAATTLVLSLSWTACSVAGPSPATVIHVGQNFTLKAGAFAQTPDGGLRVGFVGVTADSRCPKGVQCVWAGDGVAQVWLQRGSGPKEARELHTATGLAKGANDTGTIDGELRLVGLDPYPIAGKDTAPGEYVATLMLSAGPPGDPIR